MNRKILVLTVAVGIVAIGFYTFQETGKSSEGYVEGIEAERKEKNDMFKHSDESPLTEEQKRTFETLTYFPIAEKYSVRAELNRNNTGQVIKMAITDGSQREYYVFGNAHFHLDGKELDAIVYKSVNSKSDDLFIPFYDETSGNLTYGGGRYVEPEVIDGGTIAIDFNLSYNPYCVYNHSFRCPIPPRDNTLKVSILAGEKIPDFVH